MIPTQNACHTMDTNHGLITIPGAMTRRFAGKAGQLAISSMALIDPRKTYGRPWQPPGLLSNL